MSTSEKRPSSITFLLVGLILLVTAVGLCLTFVPVVNCPDCVWDNNYPVVSLDTTAGRRRLEALIDHLISKKLCLRCNDTRRVSFLRRFRQLDDECSN